MQKIAVFCGDVAWFVQFPVLHRAITEHQNCDVSSPLNCIDQAARQHLLSKLGLSPKNEQKKLARLPSCLCAVPRPCLVYPRFRLLQTTRFSSTRGLLLPRPTSFSFSRYNRAVLLDRVSLSQEKQSAPVLLPAFVLSEGAVP